MVGANGYGQSFYGELPLAGGGSTAVDVPFIGSVTAVYTFQLPQVTVPFIASASVVYAPIAQDQYTAAVLADAPMFYYKLDEAFGATTVVDYSGNGHTATALNGVIFGEPSLLYTTPDTCAKFEGTLSQEYIDAGDLDVGGTNITVECWCKPNGTPSNMKLVAKHNSASDVQGTLGIDSSAHPTFEITTGTGPTYNIITGATTMVSGGIYHVVGTYDGSNVRLYVNGVQDATAVAATGGIAVNAWPWAIGALHSGGGGGVTVNGFVGWIDEVAVYPTTLSGARILIHYQDGAAVRPAFIASNTIVYTPTLAGTQSVSVPFIGSATVVYAPSLPELNVPFIPSRTVAYGVFSLFTDAVYGGPGNGGEAFQIRLNANGVTDTATLAGDIGISVGTLLLTGDGAFPIDHPFMVTIDSEVIYVSQQLPGTYRMRGRGMSNTTVATHTAGSTVSWTDTYDQAISAAADIAHEFTANINSSGSYTYPGWLVCFDASQAYLSGDRYPMHVTEVLGVFDAGSGSGGSNRCDAAQPNAISTPTGASDACPASLSNPSRIASDIALGDVALCRYTNPESSVLDLGPRAVTLQSWFGLKRVDTTDHDVTFTDPTGIVVDTTGAQLTFTGTVTDEWGEPIPLITGIGPSTGLPTPGTVPYTTVTLPGTDRKMTYGPPGYNEKGWPICCLSVRQGNRRVPLWQSWDWHDFSFVYTGFGTDAVYAQLVINQNGIVYNSVPDVNFPGPQDTDGPDAVWDDASYYVGASWYVAIYNSPYLVFGPSVGGNGGGGGGGAATPIPVVAFVAGSPAITYPSPPYVQGGEGGGIGQLLTGMHVWATSGKGFA